MGNYIGNYINVMAAVFLTMISGALFSGIVLVWMFAIIPEWRKIFPKKD